MRTQNIKELITIDHHSETPKYLQVSEGVIRAIEKGRLTKGDPLPSLRQLSEELGISFDTARKAYDLLKKKSIVVAAQGKSNRVNASGPIPEFRIFLLFNTLGSPQRLLYDAFVGAFTSLAQTDLHVYNDDLRFFEEILKTRTGGYTHYVIIPHLADDPLQVGAIIDKHLGGRQIVLLDKMVNGIQSPYASVHEDFDNDIYHALKKSLPRLCHYSVLHLVCPEESYYPELLKGFLEFCTNNAFDHRTHTGVRGDLEIKKGDAFIVLSDDDLAALILKVRAAGLKIGHEAGIISYNETPLKELLLDGITTMSTDFRLMGKLAAQQVMQNGTEKIAVPVRLMMRRSL